MGGKGLHQHEVAARSGLSAAAAWQNSCFMCGVKRRRDRASDGIGAVGLSAAPQRIMLSALVVSAAGMAPLAGEAGGYSPSMLSHRKADAARGPPPTCTTTCATSRAATTTRHLQYGPLDPSSCATRAATAASVTCAAALAPGLVPAPGSLRRFVVGAADGHVALWIIAVIYMFYGLAHVCEDFLVALNLLCEAGHPEAWRARR